MIMIVLVLRTKPSGLYRHRRGLGLYKVGYRERNLHIRIAKLAFHAKETPIRTWDKVFYLVASVQQSGWDSPLRGRQAWRFGYVYSFLCYQPCVTLAPSGVYINRRI